MGNGLSLISISLLAKAILREVAVVSSTDSLSIGSSEDSALIVIDLEAAKTSSVRLISYVLGLTSMTTTSPTSSLNSSSSSLSSSMMLELFTWISCVYLNSSLKRPLSSNNGCSLLDPNILCVGEGTGVSPS